MKNPYKKNANIYPDYNLSRPLGSPKYRINYHINNNYILTDIIVDTDVYKKGDKITLEGYEKEDFYFSNDGNHAYQFLGWSFDPQVTKAQFNEEDEITVANCDINLYAVWSKEFTLDVDIDGVFKFKQKFYNKSISTLIVPEYTYWLQRIKEVDTGAFNDETLIDTIILPPSIVNVKADAFKDWNGTTIRFIDSEVTTKYPGLNFEEGAFNDTPTLTKLLIPYRWIGAEGLLTNIQDKHISFYIRNTKEKMEELIGEDVEEFDIEAFLVPDEEGTFKRKLIWGYND